MSTVLDGGCLVFDLETTGPDPETARIVQGCTATASVVDGEGQWQAEVELVQPGIPIPPEATEVHHITDEQVVDAITEARYAGLVALSLDFAWSKGWPVVAFNGCYDLTVLDRALRRAGESGIDGVGPVIDPFVIDKACDRYRRGKRTLTAMAELYGVPIPEGAAHTADGDCYTTLRIAHKQLSKLVRPRDDGWDAETLGGGDPNEAWPRLLGECTLGQLQLLQTAWYHHQKVSLFAYFDRIGTEVTDRSTDWPIRPWTGA